MLKAILSGGRIVAGAILLLAILAATRARAADMALGVTPDQLGSFEWWVGSAQHCAEAVQDADVRSDLYYGLAYVQLHAGELASASATAAQVTNPQKSVYIHTALAERYHQRGDDEACREELQTARDVVLATEKNRTGNFLYSHLIQAYVELGMPEEAKSLADSLPPWFDRDLGLRYVASGLAKRGQLEAALAVAKNDVSAKSREAALAEVAVACAGEARIEDTQAVVQELQEAEQRDRVYATLVKALAKAGRLSEAQAAVAQIVSPEKKADAESAVLFQWADKQDPETIEARLKEVSTREEKLSLYKQLIEKLTAVQKIDEAEAAIEAMVAVIKQSPRPTATSKFGQYGDSFEIASARAQYLPLASILAKRNDLAEARRCIARAAEPILQLPPESGLGKGMLLVQLVSTQAEIGDLKDARRSLEEIKEGFPRSMAASVLAPAFVKAGDVPSALQVAALIDNLPSGKGTYVEATVKELIRSGDVAAAKQAFADLGDSAAEAKSYRAAGRTMLETHRGDELYQWLPDMPSDVARAFACIGAAEGLKPPKPEGS
jgi:tetratricopeptide (TPR) repeat protein